MCIQNSHFTAHVRPGWTTHCCWLTLALTVAILQGCATTYQKISSPCAREEGTVLYQQTLPKDGIPTSRVKFFFNRTSVGSGSCFLLLSGELRNISAFILFPEDVRVIHSKFRYCYETYFGWYETKERQPSRVVRVLKEEVAPASLPGHLLPFGFDSGYRFTRKVLKRNGDMPVLDESLENEFDSVSVIFDERRRVQNFLIWVPLDELEPSKEYLMKIIVKYNDGQTRIIDESFYLKLD